MKVNNLICNTFSKASTVQILHFREIEFFLQVQLLLALLAGTKIDIFTITE